jgi:hypothetical protein
MDAVWLPETAQELVVRVANAAEGFRKLGAVENITTTDNVRARLRQLGLSAARAARRQFLIAGG